MEHFTRDINHIRLDSRMSTDMLGLIPHFLHPDDPRPAKEQLNARYAHGGGWQKLFGFEGRWQEPQSEGDFETLHLNYEDDPELSPLWMIRFGNERVFIYPHAFVAIAQDDNSFEVARMD